MYVRYTVGVNEYKRWGQEMGSGRDSVHFSHHPPSSYLVPCGRYKPFLKLKHESNM